MSTSDYRTAGIFLLLTALATAISVPARLAADADATPLTDALAQSQTLAVAEIARLEMSEKLAAIGSASNAYGVGGAARLVGGSDAAGCGRLPVAGYADVPSCRHGPSRVVAGGIGNRLGGVRRVPHRSALAEPLTVASGASGRIGLGKCIAQPGPRIQEAGMTAGSRRGPVRHPLGHRLPRLHAGRSRAGRPRPGAVAHGRHTASHRRH